MDPRFPTGKFTFDQAAAADKRRDGIAAIASFPGELKAAMNGARLDQTYRDGGWTARQVVHHVADSHINAFARLKVALTEDGPTIMPYDEKKFAVLADTMLPVEISLQLLQCLHARWVAIYETIAGSDWQRIFVHPEYPDPLTLDWQVQMYGWHSRHHVAHVTELRRREGW